MRCPQQWVSETGGRSGPDSKARPLRPPVTRGMQHLAGAGAAFLALLELVADGAQETRAPGDSLLALDAER